MLCGKTVFRRPRDFAVPLDEVTALTLSGARSKSLASSLYLWQFLRRFGSQTCPAASAYSRMFIDCVKTSRALTADIWKTEHQEPAKRAE